ncbi:MinD/ParA family protein [Cerasibacillus terrae]|uniref:MinD/ParA family protein n=1 Tax=Cerasibacillus terrae TaxID=2498845 RepID=A0A5C8P276_9BACI|nr:MinD/ParA family protein [Cerasibacillus terrae]TXL67699.1 MinD/ParA family protein [Cerasibacillus terrae]
MGDQAENLRQQIYRSSNKRNHAKTISFVSGKGGVGKSNISLNFAIEMQQRGKKVLIIDMDIGMGNMEVLLGLQAKHSIVDLFVSRFKLHDIIQQGPKNLSFIAGGSGLTNLFTVAQEDMNYFFEEYEKALQHFDFILFDMGAGIDEKSLSFILASDECIVITTPEPTAITDAYSMIKHILHHDRSFSLYIVMNRVSHLKKGKEVANQFKQIIFNFLHREVDIIGILPNDSLVSKAVVKQKPYLLLNENAPISKAVKRLVGNYLNEKVEKQIVSLSFIDKLKTFIRKR